MQDMAFSMPRGLFAIAGNNYAQILTRTLPSTIQGLELLGYIQNKHFFVGHAAPKKWKWPSPFSKIQDYSTSIHFISGTVFNLFSLKTSGRGANLDGFINDESGITE